METFLVEQFWPGITEESFRLASDRVRASALELGGGVRLLRSTLVPRDEAVFCVLCASSEALVAEAFRRAGVSYERILTAVEIDGGLPA